MFEHLCKCTNKVEREKYFSNIIIPNDSQAILMVDPMKNEFKQNDLEFSESRNIRFLFS